MNIKWWSLFSAGYCTDIFLSLFKTILMNRNNTTNADADRRNFPCPNGCGRYFATRAGLASHRRGKTCTARQPQPQPDQGQVRVEAPPRRLAITNSNRIPLAPIPNLLYMTAIQGNEEPRDDDNFSIISEQLENYRIPNDLLEYDEYTPAREDGRRPGIIEFVQEKVRTRAPLRSSFRSVALRTGQGFLILFDLFLKFMVIFFFYLAIYFCHDGKCTSQTHTFFADSKKVEDMLSNSNMHYEMVYI